MENLLVLLDKIQQISPLPVFAQDTVIVQNAGMQHWLNMSLAQQRGISMNMRYALPSQYLWKLIRSVANDEDVPEQSPYSREVLTWRIDSLLASENVYLNDDFNSATQYWRNSPEQRQSNGVSSESERLKRYQLSGQLADLYEQYLIFRPEWIDAWHRGEFHAFDVSSGLPDNEQAQPSHAVWQGKLWQLLVSEQAYNPSELVKLAVEKLANNKQLKQTLLPTRLSFFGINAMAPMWLEFIHALSEEIDIHFFHLNPCYAYWGDIVTEKNALQTWIKGCVATEHTTSSTKANATPLELNHGLADINDRVGNPLLANLGQQGREFMALLTQYSTINIDVFDAVVEDEQSADAELKTQQTPILAKIQQDVLSLTDARMHPKNIVDDSIVITSAHSALREVQGLHDWLLHQFNQDPSLTPKDVLVMCPQVEHYAPYVNAVFTRGWQELADEVPPLPCSIADRVSKDAEPLVAAFSELLNLPDSRFQVSSLVALMRLPAMQKRFAITLDDIDKISHWLELASIHWGVDQAHKQAVLAPDSQALNSNSTEQNQVKTREVSNSFTWQQGLARLMRGFAFSDHSVVYQSQLLLPTVEGNDSELLGKLMLIIEQLQLSAISMKNARNAEQWQQYLQTLLAQLFDDETDNGLNIINKAIESLVEYCQHAGFSEKISLSVLREFLNNHFSQPDPGRQFMVGQVTFCSMLPMRSIPFKVIAVLGLNDGEFPRQRQPLSFDLMATTPAKLGDRSRRGDDRYLFLEAIISARQALYLSYQGRNIKNNKTREPSLVLKELMEYLARGYGWDLLDINQGDEFKKNTGSSQVRQLPMQAFSVDNYCGHYASFDANWLNLARQDIAGNGHSSVNNTNENNLSNSATGAKATLATNETEQSELNVSHGVGATELISFYQHPARYYGQRQLYLYFDSHDVVLNDSEPFVADRLQSYLLRENLLAHYLNPKHSVQDETQIINSALLSGKLPELPNTKALIAGWQQDSIQFSEYIKSELGLERDEALAPIMLDCTVTLDLAPSHVEHLASMLPVTSETISLPKQVVVKAQLPVINDKLVFFRASQAKTKDLFTLYLHQLILQVAQDQAISMPEQAGDIQDIATTHGYYFDTKGQKPSQFYFSDIVEAKLQLQRIVATFCFGQKMPLLLNGDIAEKVNKSKIFAQPQFEQFWHDKNRFSIFGDDAYINYFWPSCPQYPTLEIPLLSIYQPMFAAKEAMK